jgi:hypothetical protein
MPAIPTSVDTLFAVAQALLAAANTALVDNALTPPTHQFVAYNAPAWDCCDHLTVHFENLKLNQASSASQQRKVARVCAQAFATDMVLTLIECVPTGDPLPADADMETSAHGFYQRAWVLYQGLSCDLDFGDLFPGCHIVKMGALTPHGPQGGCASFTVTFTVELS